MICFTDFLENILLSKDARRRTANLFSFLLNLCYIFFNLISGIIYENVLSVTVAAYYTVIILVRYLVMGETGGRDTPERLQAARLASRLLLISAFPIVGIVAYTVITDSIKRYPKWILAVLLIYSVFASLRAAAGMFNSRGENLHVMHTAYSARLSAALMSLFNFQASFFSEIADSSYAAGALNLLLGSLISVSVFYLAFKSSNNKKRNKS